MCDERRFKDSSKSRFVDVSRLETIFFFEFKFEIKFLVERIDRLNSAGAYNLACIEVHAIFVQRYDCRRGYSGHPPALFLRRIDGGYRIRSGTEVTCSPCENVR